jgi:hypothetical protein
VGSNGCKKQAQGFIFKKNIIMDAALEILLPQDTDLASLGFKVPTFTWQGVEYPQGKPECTFGKNFILKVLESYDMRFVLSKIPAELRNTQWMPIAVLGEGLDIYNADIFGLQNEEEEFSLRKLFDLVLKPQRNWIVIYSPQYDGFNKIKQGSVNDIFNELECSIKNTREGFLIYG